MNRIDAILVKVFLYGLPAVVVFAVFSYAYNAGALDRTAGVVSVLNNAAGLVYASWMLLSIALSIRLLTSGAVRERILARLAFIRERDERETVLTGKATKTAYLTSLAILIFLLCLSCFQVSIYRVPPEKAVNGKTGVVSLGISCNLLDRPNRAGGADGTLRQRDIFTYDGLPVSSTAVILALIVWQICSYNITVRRLIRTP